MVFNSLLFVAFFVTILVVSQVVTSNSSWKRFLLVASYLFYCSWGWWQLPLMAAITVVSFVASEAIRAHQERWRSPILAAAVLIDLGVLATFKYVPLASEALVALDWIQTPLSSPPLPVGISFFTFQAISFLVDVRRAPEAPRTTFLDFALYVAFFPQLVAGPIVRTQEMIPQFARKPEVSATEVERGACLFAIGLFLKSVLADAIFAPVATGAHSRVEHLTAFEAWIGCVSFSGQIYCDFAGYSLCAIGSARVLGYSLPSNFRNPYASASFRDFWRRWHISLSTWLRDYLYIPLGGSRHGRARTALALVATMVLGGLWHGASTTFLVWGFLHGIALAVERFFWYESTRPSPFVLLWVCVLWIPFRADTWSDCLTYFTRLVSSGSGTTLSSVTLATALVSFLVMVLAQWVCRDRDWISTVDDMSSRRRIILCLSALFLAMTDATGGATFIYFQF